MKQLCLDNGLPVWDDSNGWLFIEDIIRGLSIDNEANEFYCYNVKFKYGKTQVTEEQFIQLLKNR